MLRPSNGIIYHSIILQCEILFLLVASSSYILLGRTLFGSLFFSLNAMFGLVSLPLTHRFLLKLRHVYLNRDR